MNNDNDTNHLILNLVKQVKSIGYQLSTIDASSGPLLREEFQYVGSQVFTTSSGFNQVYSVEARGVGALSDSQYTITPPNTITILDPLEVDDFVVVLYAEAGVSPQPYYSQAQIDQMLQSLEEDVNDYTDDSFIRGAKLYSRTGIISKKDQFELTVLDINTVNIGIIDSAVFWEQFFIPDAVPDNAIRSFTALPYPLTELVTATGLNTNEVPLTTDGLYVRYLGYDIVGGVVSSPNSFIESTTIVQLGFVTVVKTGGVVSFLSAVPGGRNAFSQPLLASLNDLDRITVNSTTDITINYNTGTPSLSASAGVITGIAINWRGLNNPGNTSPIDKFSYFGDAVVDFASIDFNFLEDVTPPTIHTLWTELAEGVQINKSFYNTVSGLRDTLTVGSFSIKRVLIGLRGGIFIQEGEHATSVAYTTIDEAKANVYTLPFSNAIHPADIVIEIARIIFKESVTDFTDPSKFFIVGTLGKASSGGAILPVADATTTSKGIVQLAGDLAGTATAPTVPGLALKANDSAVVHLAGTETITGAKTFSSQVVALSFKTPTGLSTQFLKADGTLDSTVYQTNLVSGTDIKTINGNTILGSGNLVLNQQIAYNNSTVPQVTVTDALGPETFKNGRSTDASNVIEVKNIAGTTTVGLSGSGNLNINGSIEFPTRISAAWLNGSFTSNYIGWNFNNTDGFVLYHNTTDGGVLDSKRPFGLTVRTSVSAPVMFQVNSVEKARLSTGGNFLINTTTDNAVDKLQVNGSLTATTIKKSGGIAGQYLMADGSVTTTPVSLITANVQTGTTYTLVSTDVGKQVIFTNSSSITCTIPSGLPSGFQCEVLQQGLGQVNFVGSGTTIRISTFELPSTAERYSLVGIDNMPNLTEEFHIYGALLSI